MTPAPPISSIAEPTPFEGVLELITLSTPLDILSLEWIIDAVERKEWSGLWW